MKYIVSFYDYTALICFMAMFACIIIEVICRNLLFMPTTWAEEASRLFCVWSVFLGSASAWHRGAHIAIDVLSTRISGFSKTTLQMSINILCLVFFGAVWFGTLSIMQTSYPSKTTALEISISYFYLGLFLGLTGMVIFQIDAMIGMIKKLYLTGTPEQAKESH
ncbi:TRAP transporter small permease [Desulfococcaceae bacterium HSG9]|nr:TRAP transporter small permease [Desulfococcaceae bacterium HSG9]